MSAHQMLNPREAKPELRPELQEAVEPMGATAAGHNRAMTDAEYELERTRLRETYGDSPREAAVHRSQELAKLFSRSNWSAERLAKKEGKASSFVAKILVFGRFLRESESHTGGTVLKNLTEKRFRDYWLRIIVEGSARQSNERIRFREVRELMEAELKSKALSKAWRASYRAGYADAEAGKPPAPSRARLILLGTTTSGRHGYS